MGYIFLPEVDALDNGRLHINRLRLDFMASFVDVFSNSYSHDTGNGIVYDNKKFSSDIASEGSYREGMRGRSEGASAAVEDEDGNEIERTNSCIIA